MIVASTTGGALGELTPAGQNAARRCSRAGSQAFGAASDATDRTGALNLFESASVGDAARHRHAGHRQVRGLAQPGREPAAGRPELPLQPPDRRLRRRDRSCRCRRSRRSPTTTSSSPRRRREGRPGAADEPGRRRHRARAAARLRRADRPRRPGLPEGDRRLAVRAGRASPTTAAWPTSRARATCSSGRPKRRPASRVAVVPPRPAGQRQLRPRRHAAGPRAERLADRARRRALHARVHGARRRRLVRDPDVLHRAAPGARPSNSARPPRAAATVTREVTLPAGARKLTLQAEDEAGNLGPVVTVKAAR